MTTHTNLKPAEEQVTLFELFAQQFPMPEEISAPQGRSKRTRRAKNNRIEILEEQLEFMLDILETPDAILEIPDAWTDEEIIELRCFMLLRHFKYILDGRNGSKSVTEAWDWIMDDSIAPFSFSVCVHAFAKSVGLADSETTSVDCQEVRLVFYTMAQRAGRKPDFSLS